MDTQQLSREQLADLVKDIEKTDTNEAGSALQKDFKLSGEGLDELVKRLAAFNDGELSARPWNDIKKDFGPI
ncbi:MAG: hypothetical protein ACO1N1_05015 [Dyadobacter fermentans]